MTVDVRGQDQERLLARAEQALDVALRGDQAVSKRRSLGAPSERGTWVRLSVCAASSAACRGGLEDTAGLPDEVACPQWLRSQSWRDEELVWRVDETEQVTEPVIQAGGILTEHPDLTEQWWQRLHTSLQALAIVDTARLATPHTRPITQRRVSDLIAMVAPEVETTIDEWSVAHADLSWVNLTAPQCWLLDWEDFGAAPRGWDAATLWAASLAVPALAERVQQTFAAELCSRTGLVCQLYQVAELVRAGQDYAGPLHAPARHARERLISELRLRKPAVDLGMSSTPPATGRSGA